MISDAQSSRVSSPAPLGKTVKLRQVRPESGPPGNAQARPSSVVPVSTSPVTGFGPMPRISMNFGEVHAHVVRKGDMVRELSGAYLPIVAVDQIRLDSDFLSRHPNLQPVRIRRGAFGASLPAQDVILAPSQRVRPGPVRSNVPFVRAEQLLGRPYVERAQESQIVYTRFSVGHPSVIMCEGLSVELEV